MTWARQDDSFYDHPKVRRMPRHVRNAACGLYWRAIALCNRHLTDGRLTDEDIELIDGSAEEVEALVAVRLFDRTRAGLKVHDFLAFNRSKAQVIEERQKKADAGRQGGIASGKQRRSRTRSKREAPASQVVELQTRPVPTHPASNEAGPPAPQPDAHEVYMNLTGSWPSQKVTPWITRLSDDFGEEAVCRALIVTWEESPDRMTLLSRTRDRLAADAHRAAREAEESRAREDAEYERQERERRENASPEERARAAEVRAKIREFVGGLGT